MDIGPPELLIIAAIILVLFGGSKLPQLARSLGKAKHEFQKGLSDGEHESAAAPASPAAAPSPSAAPTVAPAPEAEPTDDPRAV